MAFRSEAWITVQLTPADLEKMRAFQQAFLDNLLKSTGSYQVVLKYLTNQATTQLTKAALKKIFFIAGVASNPALTTMANVCVAMIDLINEGAANDEKNNLTAGRKAIDEVKSYMAKNKDYKLVEVTFRRRIFTDPSNGIQVGMILGNPGKISAAYEIKRVQLANGKWLEK
ncbi:hypothetical protein WKI11_22520 (plasmid) [Enterococcus avium]|uniref:hypothetical protein n=1 Tax=Enterococcus TaxID=1350 RepID=UPI000F516120|nr:MULTISPECIES: hypothetical protein [Enterococcus]ROY84882.1 hypothetical protein EGW76_15020 [Enterococcus gallinarum]